MRIVCLIQIVCRHRKGGWHSGSGNVKEFKSSTPVFRGVCSIQIAWTHESRKLSDLLARRGNFRFRERRAAELDLVK